MSITPRPYLLASLLPLACDLQPVPKDSKHVPGASEIQPLLSAVPDEEPSASPGPTRSGALGPSLVASKPAREVVARRYVAIFDKLVDQPCPAATAAGWAAEPLFRSGDAAPLIQPKGAPLPLPLERFCRYMWTGKGLPAAAPAFDPTWTGKQIRIDPDLDVLLPQTASTYLGADPTLRADLGAAFRQRAGVVGSGAASPVYTSEAVARVAVIDTVGHADAATTSAAAPAHRRHGLAMAELIADVRCPNGEAQCRDRLLFADAFPYTGASALAQPGGGPLGSLGSLAHAIGEATIRARPKTPDERPMIVLNLSVAWDPEYGAELTPPGDEVKHDQLLTTPSSTIPATVQAVHAALVYASCLDMLTIAAAGNNAGAPCEQQGVMPPARWERYPAPNQARCAALFGALPAWRTGDPAVASASKALVYAAGGVVADSQPIPLARPGGTPARVLPAFQAVAGAGARQTDAWTGTSIATAALSGLAAQLWTHNPQLSPAQVIELITASGEPTALTDELTARGKARRASGHAAFARMCATGRPDMHCTNPYAPATAPAPVQAPAPTLASLSAGPASALTCTTATASCGAAESDIVSCGDAGAPPPAPPPLPWLRPQPVSPICPICPVRGGKLTLSLNPDHSAAMAVLDNPTLEFRLRDGSWLRAGLGPQTVGSAAVDVDLARYTVTAGQTAQTIAAALTANNVTAATLAFYVVDAAGGRTRSSSAVSVVP